MDLNVKFSLGYGWQATHRMSKEQGLWNEGVLDQANSQSAQTTQTYLPFPYFGFLATINVTRHDILPRFSHGKLPGVVALRTERGVVLTSPLSASFCSFLAFSELLEPFSRNF